MVAPVRVGRTVCNVAVLLVIGPTAGCLKPETRHFVPGPTLAKGLECRNERVTGELVPTRICTVKAQRDAEQQSVQDAKDFLTRQPVSACPGPGCKP